MKSSNTYASAGVDTSTEDKAMPFIWRLFRSTLDYNKDLVQNIYQEDHYAAVVKVSESIGVAIKTDGVGTKTFVAQLMEKYDTVGIDCVAMSVNDIICVGAKPTTFIDYLALHNANKNLIEEIAKGLKKGADISKVSIVGGETAIMPEMIEGVYSENGFDLAGSALGIVHPNRVILGDKINEGDVLIGISSSGIHSNGLTLARDVLDVKHNIHKYYDDLGRTLGEELLEPTSIYIDEIMDMISSNLNLKVVAHITSHGLNNLRRIGKNFGYHIHYLPEPEPIYRIIQEKGDVTDSEMYKVFNMGIGMCVVVPKEEKDRTIEIAEHYGKTAFELGHSVLDRERKIVLKPKNMNLKLVSKDDDFIKL